MREHKHTPNTYRIEGTIAYLALTDKAGTGLTEAIIDVTDLQLVLAKGRWFANPARPSVLGRQYVKVHRGRVLLHRFLMGVTERTILVDHQNRNGLDCRRCNLRVCTHAQNMQNRKVHRHSGSGKRNVGWDKRRNMWRVIVRVNNVKHFIGRFALLEDATVAATEARARLMTHATD